MKAYVIFTGTELLLGKTLNTNSQYLGGLFADLGIGLYKTVTVGDNQSRIVRALEEAPEDADLILLNGGLGPTEDDLTREALLEYLGIGSVSEPRTREKILRRVSGNPLSGDLKVAEIPEGSIPFFNEAGVAPASLVEVQGRRYILTPGPPQELKHLMEDNIIPYFRENGLLPKDVIHSITLKFTGIGESKAEDKIRDLIRGDNPTVAPTIKGGEIHFRVTGRGSQEEIQNQVELLARKIRMRLEDYYIGCDGETLEQRVAELLTERRLTLAVAESCTGGFLAHTLTNISGSSAFFDRGFITYSNKAKMDELGVQEAVLEQYGAVSEAVARDMALGTREKSGADLAISITGIAGPDGGTEDKPVGLVYMGFALQGETVVVQRIFNGDRLTFKQKVVKFILFEILKKLKEN